MYIARGLYSRITVNCHVHLRCDILSSAVSGPPAMLQLLDNNRHILRGCHGYGCQWMCHFPCADVRLN